MGSTFEVGPANARTAPGTVEDRELVYKELETILASYHFRGSKRYPALLKYVVEASLDGRLGDLKERTLGVEVFGRDPDYDTNADPVVRISAGEVRKRIAQYYHESGAHSRVQIEIPLGSYAPEFRFAPGASSAAVAPLEVVRHAERPVEAIPGKRRRLTLWLILGTAALAGGVYALIAHFGSASGPQSTENSFWAPFINSPGQAFVVAGTIHPDWMPPATPETSYDETNKVPYHHVSLSSAIAMTHVAGVLRLRNKAFAIKEAADTSLTDIHHHPLVLIGGRNNDWTMRLLGHLRFHIQATPVATIQDSQNPQNTQWTVDVNQPFNSVTTDYAIVARYYDATTEAPVIIIAGLGPYGTEAASEFIDSPEYLEQLTKKAPAGWEKRNCEMIVKTEVIGTRAGPPVLVTAYTW